MVEKEKDTEELFNLAIGKLLFLGRFSNEASVWKAYKRRAR